MTARPKLTEEERAAVNRANAMAGVKKRELSRLALGLPARVPGPVRRPQYLDPSIEPLWMARSEELGLVPEGASRSERRRIARRTADRHVEAAAERPAQGGEPDDRELALSYWQKEAEMWRARAVRDRAVAADHDRRADEAEDQVAAIYLELRQS